MFFKTHIEVLKDNNFIDVPLPWNDSNDDSDMETLFSFADGAKETPLKK